MTSPKRIRLSRARGWRLPAGAVNCARPGKLGNPFVVTRDGTREKCVRLYALLMTGYVCLSNGPELHVQNAARAAAMSALDDLRGRDLACWCRLDGKPCHADVLLVIANEAPSPGYLDRFLAVAA